MHMRVARAPRSWQAVNR